MLSRRAEHLEALRCALRRRGWQVRAGIQYGGDLLLYNNSSNSHDGSNASIAGGSRNRRGRRHQQHAPFVVLLVDSSVTWRVVCAVSRVAASVKKELLLAVPVPAAVAGSSSATIATETAAAATAESTAIGGEGSLAFRLLRLRRFVPSSS